MYKYLFLFGTKQTLTYLHLYLIRVKELRVVLFFSAIFDIGVVALRILLPVYAIVIVYQCYAAMRRRRRPETPLVTLVNSQTGLKLPVLFWEIQSEEAGQAT